MISYDLRSDYLADVYFCNAAAAAVSDVPNNSHFPTCESGVPDMNLDEECVLKNFSFKFIRK
jgi:hypothetical protein